MNNEYSAFLTDLDQHLSRLAGQNKKLDLYMIGGAAMIMHYGLPRTTKDFDVLQTTETPLLKELASAFGKNTRYAQEHDFYLEVVPAALPNIPEGFKLRCTEMTGYWNHLILWKLEVHDLLITKLRRFSPQDRADIRFVCDRESVDPRILQERLDSALAWYYKDDEYQEGPRNHLARVVAYLDGKIDSI